MPSAESGVASSSETSLEPQPWERRDWRVVGLLFVAVLAIYLATATYTIAQTNDARSAAVAAWNVAHRGELALPDWGGEDRNYWAVEGRDGRIYSNRFPGVIAWGVPFYLAQRAVFGADDPGHPFLVDFRPAGVAAATAAALGVVMAYAVGRRLADRREAFAFALVLGFATPFWSVAADALWPHAITSLMLLITVWSSSVRPVRGWALAGSTAYGIFTRPHLAVVHGVMGLWALTRRRWRTSTVLAAGGVVGVAATSLYTRLVFGSWVPAAGYDQTAVGQALSRSWTETARGVWLAGGSLDRGVFIWTPFLILLMPFLARGWRSAPDWARIAAVAGLPYLLLQLHINPWLGGVGYFAYRVPIETLVLAAPLLLRTWQVSLRQERILRTVFLLMICASVAVHAYGASGAYDREGEAEWRQIVDRVSNEQTDSPA